MYRVFHMMSFLMKFSLISDRCGADQITPLQYSLLPSSHAAAKTSEQNVPANNCGRQQEEAGECVQQQSCPKAAKAFKSAVAQS
jgi:hypothetical protein